MQPTSANFAAFQCRDVAETHPARNFFRYNKKNEKRENVGGNGIQDGEDDTGRFERSCNPYTCFFFLELLLIKTK